MNNEKIINIYLINNQDALVWDSNDIYEIRSKYRIVGSLLGSVENLKNLSTINSIPLLLSPCEIKLGLEKGWFKLIDEGLQYPIVESTEIDQFLKAREDIYKLQVDNYVESKIQKEKEYRLKYSNINNSKNKKNKKDKDQPQQPQQPQQSQSQSQEKVEEEIKKKELTKEEEEIEDNQKKLIEKDKILKNFKNFNNDIYIYTSTKEAIENEPTSKQWRDKRKFNELSLEDYKFPIDKDEELKYTVFKDLWNRGYFISGGSKFGGTFLVYKGDPFLYHATFIVILKHFTEKFQSIDILTSSRLAVNVNKTTLFASIDNKTNKPNYISIIWKGVT